MKSIFIGEGHPPPPPLRHRPSLSVDLIIKMILSFLARFGWWILRVSPCPSVYVCECVSFCLHGQQRCAFLYLPMDRRSATWLCVEYHSLTIVRNGRAGRRLTTNRWAIAFSRWKLSVSIGRVFISVTKVLFRINRSSSYCFGVAFCGELFSGASAIELIEKVSVILHETKSCESNKCLLGFNWKIVEICSHCSCQKLLCHFYTIEGL